MDEIYITSRSRTPSLIDVRSQNERVFAQLPDLIQEAAVSTECLFLGHEGDSMLTNDSFESEAQDKSSSECKNYRHALYDTAYVLHHNKDRLRH